MNYPASILVAYVQAVATSPPSYLPLLPLAAYPPPPLDTSIHLYAGFFRCVNPLTPGLYDLPRLSGLAGSPERWMKIRSGFWFDFPIRLYQIFNLLFHIFSTGFQSVLSRAFLLCCNWCFHAKNSSWYSSEEHRPTCMCTRLQFVDPCDVMVRARLSQCVWPS